MLLELGLAPGACSDQSRYGRFTTSPPRELVLPRSIDPWAGLPDRPPAAPDVATPTTAADKPAINANIHKRDKETHSFP